MDYKILCNQGSDYIIEASNSDEALSQFDVIRLQRGLDKLNGFKVLGVEELVEERPVRILNGVKIR